jgi:CheY-like chemotaxis protein
LRESPISNRPAVPVFWALANQRKWLARCQLGRTAAIRVPKCGPPGESGCLTQRGNASGITRNFDHSRQFGRRAAFATTLHPGGLAHNLPFNCRLQSCAAPAGGLEKAERRYPAYCFWNVVAAQVQACVCGVKEGGPGRKSQPLMLPSKGQGAGGGEKMSVVANRSEPVDALDILVVEDLPASQKLFDRILRAAGHRVRLAANGVEAIRSFRGRRPDLILMDLQMPILDGLQTSTILCLLQSPEPRVPIIATTACSPVFDRDRFLSIGVEAFLPKPFEARQLVHLVTQLTARSAKMSPDNDASRDDPIRNEGQAASESEGAEIDIPGALERLNGDKELLTALVGFFFEDFPGLLDEIRAAFERRDWAALQRAAHSLKGLSANFGAAPAVAALQKLETWNPTRDAESQTQLLRAVEVTMARLAAALVDYHATNQGPTAGGDGKTLG